MTKIAIIDLDGVIADATARFAQAELAKEQWLMERQQGLPYAVDKFTEKSATDLYWRTVFDPANVPMDTLIEGADENIIALTLQGYEIVYLTSRPSSLRVATIVWLYQYNFITDVQEAYRLTMKEPAFQYVKTVVWKAGMIQTLAQLFDAEEVLVVDDEQANLDELQRYQCPFLLQVALSLDAAVNGKEADEDDPGHPF